VLLTCLADGRTPLAYEWFKDGKRIPDDGMWKGRIFVKSSSMQAWAYALFDEN